MTRAQSGSRLHSTILSTLGLDKGTVDCTKVSFVSRVTRESPKNCKQEPQRLFLPTFPCTTQRERTHRAEPREAVEGGRCLRSDLRQQRQGAVFKPGGEALVQDLREKNLQRTGREANLRTLTCSSSPAHTSVTAAAFRKATKVPSSRHSARASECGAEVKRRAGRAHRRYACCGAQCCNRRFTAVSRLVSAVVAASQETPGPRQSRSRGRSRAAIECSFPPPSAGRTPFKTSAST